MDGTQFYVVESQDLGILGQSCPFFFPIVLSNVYYLIDIYFLS